MKRCAAFVVHFVDIKTLEDGKVVQADRLVTLCGNMETVGPIDVRYVYVGAHLVDYKLDKFEVAVV